MTTIYGPLEKVNLVLEIIHHNPRHIEMTTFPDSLKVPNSIVTLDSLTLPEDEISGIDYINVLWSVDDKVFTQVFSVDLGRFPEPEGYVLLTGRINPDEIYITSTTAQQLFLQRPSIKKFSKKDNDNIEYIGNVQSVKLNFLFKRVISPIERVWEGLTTFIPAYGEYLSSLITNL